MSGGNSNVGVTMADRLLEDMRDTQRAMSTYLVNGFQLKGTVVGFDEATILIKVKEAHQLVMRSAVASMYPLPDSRHELDEWWLKYTEDSG